MLQHGLSVPKSFNIVFNDGVTIRLAISTILLLLYVAVWVFAGLSLGAFSETHIAAPMRLPEIHKFLEVVKIMIRTEMKVATVIMSLLSTAAWASPLSPAVKKVIPTDVRQIISVDYLTVKKLDMAMTLKAQVLPDNLKEFDSALKSIGVNPDSDLNGITFASFDNGKLGLQMVGVASGALSPIDALKKLTLEKMQKIKPVKYHESDLYPVSKTMTVTFLDGNTLLLGNDSALRTALNVRDSSTSTVDSNKEMTDLISPSEKAPVWSVLDRKGSQYMLVSSLGNAAKLPGFENIKNQVLGLQVLSSRYMMNFDDGFSLYLDVLTADVATSHTLASLLKAGLLYKEVTANPVQKVAWENVRIASEEMKLPSDRSHRKCISRWAKSNSRTCSSRFALLPRQPSRRN